MKNHNLTTKLHLVDCPTLVMGGDLDKIAPIEGQIIFKNYIKGSSFILIKDGSHVPQIDFQKQLMNKLKILSKSDKLMKQSISRADNLSFFIL